MSRISETFDVIVVGGGPAGSTAATLLAQEGFRVLVLERETFPRFQIGESLLPYNNELFDRLGVRSQLEDEETFPKYGAEFLTGDGRVRYTFRFGSNLPEQYARSYQVKRSRFDELLLRNAEKAGVVVREGTSVVDVDLSQPESVTIKGEDSSGFCHRYEARFVIDASGHRSLIAARTGAKREVESLRKVSFFAHYKNVSQSAPGIDAGNTVIAVVKDAWFWLIPINREITSVGIVVDRDAFKATGLPPEAVLELMIQRSPYVAERMRAAERVTQVYVRKDFSYRVEKLLGSNYVLAGDAAGFIDPIFSTGVFLAMRSAQLAADGVTALLRRRTRGPLRRYEKLMQGALDKYFAFISNFYCREFLEVFLHPHERFGLLPVVVGVLAGNVFDRPRMSWKLRLFFALVAIQKKRPVIAPRISWDRLPSVKSLELSEESVA